MVSEFIHKYAVAGLSTFSSAAPIDEWRDPVSLPLSPLFTQQQREGAPTLVSLFHGTCTYLTSHLTLSPIMPYGLHPTAAPG